MTNKMQADGWYWPLAEIIPLAICVAALEAKSVEKAETGESKKC